MIRDGTVDDRELQSAIRKTRHRRNAAARLLLAHRRAHEDLTHPKTTAAGQG